MACVTLKRPIEMLGSPHLMEHEPIVKRRRCGMSLFPTTPPGINAEPPPMNVCPESGRGSPGSSRHHNHHNLCSSPLSSVSRGTRRVKRKLDVDHYSVSPAAPVSPFMSATPPIETGKLAAQLGQELRRLQRRKYQLSEDPSLHPHPIQALSSSQVSSPIKEQPLFTLKQVTIVCQRMIKEREEFIRSEYDEVLTSKLAEQYDTFVKFSHDQVERRLAESAFSYVS